jgi:hypothetical protein
MILTSGNEGVLGQTYIFCAESSYDLRRAAMKTPTHQVLRALIAALLLGALWQALSSGGLAALPHPVHTAALLLLSLALTFSMLLRRVRSEDRVATLEAALCREQTARSQADHALAEADLLLARMAARAAGDCTGDPFGQLVVIQAELTQIQQRCGADHALRGRLELLRTRLERLGDSLRAPARAAEPG